MLARRVIPVLLNKGGKLIKGRSFNHSRVIGHTLQAIRVYQGRNVDELTYLDISGGPPDVAMVAQFASECFMPLTVGGGVRTIEQFSALISNGADKVLLNTGAMVNPSLVREAARKYGAQAVVVGIDTNEQGEIFTHSGQIATSTKAMAWAHEMELLGAGEILLTSIPRDGTLSGYDLGLIQSVSSAVSIPVVACGGAGSYADLHQALAAGAHAVAAGALWSFTDATPRGASQYLHKHGYPTRIAA